MIKYIDENEVQNSELMKELEGINVSLIATYIVGLSVFLTFLFLKSETARVTDELKGVPFAEDRPKLSYLPIYSNELLILALVIAIKSNFESLNILLSLKDSEQNRRDIQASKNSLVASVLGLISAGIVYVNLSNTSMNNFSTILINPLPFE